MAAPNASPFAQTYFSPLPDTAIEAGELKALLSDATVLTRNEATETALKKAMAPEILHIATHGFFLEPAKRESGNPAPRRARGYCCSKRHFMRRSLANSLTTRCCDQGWVAGANLLRGGNDDGILTAMEVSALNLWGTKLVVLSACDTGVGEVRAVKGFTACDAR